MTLDQALRVNADTRPEEVAILDDRRALTWSELERAVDTLAGHLLDRGLRRGQVVLAFVRRDWRLPALFLATARAGGVFLAADPRSEPAWLDRAALVVSPPDHLNTRLLADPRVLPTLDGLPDRAGPGPSSDDDAVCYLHAGSPRGGIPTAAAVTHAHVAANTRAVLSVLPFARDERFLCLFAAAAHPHEFFARALFSGATTVLVESLRPRAALDMISAAEVTRLFAPPRLARLICDIDGPPPVSLRHCEIGGADVTASLLRRAAERFACTVTPVWGCTETTGVAMWGPPTGAASALAHAIPGYELDVRGDGELYVRGEAVVNVGIALVQQAVRGDDWVATGDVVRREGDGLRFLGRREERFVVGGEPLTPADFETTLRAMPGVHDAVVVAGMDDAGRGVARVVLVTDATVRRREVLLRWRATARSDRDPLVEFWDDVPLTSSGEVDRPAVTAREGRRVALALNSMVIGDRALEEVYALAARVRADTELPVILDLRSRRAPKSDPSGTWAVAHANADFDIADPHEVDRALALSHACGVQIGMASAYVGACEPADLGYGHAVIEQAYRLAAAAPAGRLVLRVLGGDLLARARGMRDRWQDARKRLRAECVQTLQAWEAHTRTLAASTGRRVYLGLEVHHGQYLGDLADIHHCCRALRETGWEFVGFIDDPANRFIAGDGDLIGAMDFARMTRAWGGRVLAYHLKDVRHVSAWSQFHPQPMQRVGERVFVWGTQKFEWAALGAGEVDVRQAVMAARLFSDPAHPWCPISTECVSASATEVEAEAIVRAYVSLLEDA